MIAGHLQIKNDNYYMVLNYTDANGKRRQPWIPTGLPAKGNKRRAEKLLLDTRQEIKLPERVTETITDSDIDNAIELIKASKKPYIFVGGGVVLSGASKELKEFVDKVNAPVCDTLMGKGAYDGTSDNYTGMLGMHGTKTSNLGVSECDLLIAVGTRFSDRVLGNPKKFADQAKILQFDVDAAEINKNILPLIYAQQIVTLVIHFP